MIDNTDELSLEERQKEFLEKLTKLTNEYSIGLIAPADFGIELFCWKPGNNTKALYVLDKYSDSITLEWHDLWTHSSTQH